jgi:phosphinothricin acetyltransferase
VHSLIGCVSGENTGAIAFHQKLGFTQAGCLHEAGFKFGRWMDLVLMQKHL